MTGQPQTLISKTALPIDPVSCTRVYPHQYLKVNTVFEVARAHDLRTAWSDKHPAYEILSGPSGTGVQAPNADTVEPSRATAIDAIPLPSSITKPLPSQMPSGHDSRVPRAFEREGSRMTPR